MPFEHRSHHREYVDRVVIFSSVDSPRIVKVTYSEMIAKPLLVYKLVSDVVNVHRAATVV